jgi:L,D-peptidoglycan transpeptidase YkuD (ErfK/YbiS/YcfS/YnhG family)
MRVHCNDNVNLVTPWLALFLVFGGISSVFSQVPTQCRQLIVAIAPEWTSKKASLQCWQRDSAGAPWQPAFTNVWPVNLGRNGLAWGRGVSSPSNGKVTWKVEKDGKAPAGIFELGSLHGYASRPPQGANWPYLQVGPLDAWIDDPRLPQYNKHVRVDPNNIPPWFESQRMRLGDAAYKWLLEIKHNTSPPTPGYGSAIFFHVRRGVDRSSAGCTTMAIENLESMIRWLRADKKPHYVLLPQAEYDRLRKDWGMPAQ